jgi:hypothetical protein
VISKKVFTKFDYGALGNIKNYGQSTPPVYNVAGFPDSVPLMAISGGQDILATPENVEFLVTLMGSKMTTTLSLEQYSHGDFVTTSSGNIDFFPQTINFIQQHCS